VPPAIDTNLSGRADPIAPREVAAGSPRVVLIHPPINDPRSPRLALPSLAACLRTWGIATRQIDLDLESLLAVLTPERILRDGRRLRTSGGASAAAWVENAETLARRAESLAEQISAALAVLRDPERFFAPGELSSARDLIFDAVELVGAAADPPVRYRLDLLQYDVLGVDPARLSDLIAAASLPRANVFHEHWEEKLYPSLERDAPDLVGISVSTRMQIIPALALARGLKRRGHFVVLGGSLLTKFAERLALLPEFFAHFADAVVVHEGETALAALLEEIRGNRVLERVPNLLYATAGRVRRTRVHQEDLRQLPTPDFDGLPLERYLSPLRVLPVRFGRGCYWNRCRFCSSSKVNRLLPQRYRTRAPAQVVADMLGYRERYGCRHFVFVDEALPPPALDQIAELLLARGEEELRFSTYARFEVGFSRERLVRAARAGLRQIYFGLEAADQATLDEIDKGISLPVVVPVLRGCRDAGIRYFVFTMYGLPGQGAQSIRETAAFFQRNRDLFTPDAGDFTFRPFELQEGTPYADEPGRHGIVFPPGSRERELVVSFGRRWTCARDLGNEELERLAGSLNVELLKMFPNLGVFPPLLWPALEEWSLLYASHFGSGPLPSRLSLPEEAGALCRLRWDPFATVADVEGRVIATNRRASVETSPESYRGIAATGFQPPAAILGRFAGHRVEPGSAAAETASESLQALLRTNLLQLQCRGKEQT